MMIRHALTLVLLVGLNTGCPRDSDDAGAEPDYTAPGHNGMVVEGDPARGAEYHADRVLPAMGECGGTYTVLATVRQQVAGCAGYDHGPLYERARIDAEGLSTEFNCPAECTPPYTWVSYHRWGCIDLFQPVIASASVEVSAMCPLEPFMPESLPAPDPAALVGQDGEAGGPPGQEPGLFDEIGGTVEVQCNATELAVFEYFQPVAACDPSDFEPHVDEAERLAQKYHSSIPCKSGCPRAPFAPRRVEWACEDQNGQPTVSVRVLFDVRCPAP